MGLRRGREQGVIEDKGAAKVVHDKVALGVDLLPDGQLHGGCEMDGQERGGDVDDEGGVYAPESVREHVEL